MKSEAKKSGSYVLEMIKALVIAIIISLIGVLLAALIIKLCNLPDKVIPIINQVIKGLSILIACLISFKLPHNGWVRGIVMGIFYIALSFVVFSLLDGKFNFGLSLLNDVALGAVTGLISGIIAVNIRKHS